MVVMVWSSCGRHGVVQIGFSGPGTEFNMFSCSGLS